MALQGVKGSTVGNEKSQKVTIWRELEYGLLAWWYALCGAVPLLKNLGAYFFFVGTVATDVSHCFGVSERIKRDWL